jgi:hypothetical protein
MTFDFPGIGCRGLLSENQGVWQSGPYRDFESGVDPRRWTLSGALRLETVWLKVDPRLYVLCSGEDWQTREGMAPILWKSLFLLGSLALCNRRKRAKPTRRSRSGNGRFEHGAGRLRYTHRNSR